MAEDDVAKKDVAKKAMVDSGAVRDWMQRMGIKVCAACGSDKLTVSKDLYALICISPRTRAPDVDHGSRLVRLRCGRCSHLMLFHARQMGIK